MAINETLGNLGYVLVGKETTKGTAVTPSVAIPAYATTMMTDIGLIEDNPIMGNKFLSYQAIQGLRSHKGDIEFMAEPNTAGYIFDMLLTHGSPSGGGPYTHPFTLSTTVNPNSYTIDLSYNNVVARFFGVEAYKIVPKWDKNEMHLTGSFSGLGSFLGRQIASVSGSGPYTVVLDTTYDPSPTTGLVASDLIRFYHAGSATVDATITAVTNATTFTTSTNPTPATTGDYVYLRPQTPTFTLLTPFQWARSEYRFGATASAALTAAQTRLETGTEWQLMHNLESDSGAQRSGAYDPAALVRLQGDAMFKIKKFFNTPDDVQNWEQINKTACVIRHFSGTTNQYELRITLNNLKIKAGAQPKMDTSKVNYSEIDFSTSYDSSDAQGMDVKILNNVSSF